MKEMNISFCSVLLVHDGSNILRFWPNHAFGLNQNSDKVNDELKPMNQTVSNALNAVKTFFETLLLLKKKKKNKTPRTLTWS